MGIMEYQQKYERNYDPDLDDTITRTLGSLGLVDATLYSYDIPERVDSQWAENPAVVLSSD